MFLLGSPNWTSFNPASTLAVSLANILAPWPPMAMHRNSFVTKPKSAFNTSITCRVIKMGLNVAEPSCRGVSGVSAVSASLGNACLVVYKAWFTLRPVGAADAQRIQIVKSAFAALHHEDIMLNDTYTTSRFCCSKNSIGRLKPNFGAFSPRSSNGKIFITLNTYCLH